MKDVEIIQIIKTNNLKRGLGIEGDPLRRITQYWDLDGNLLFEWDPFASFELKTPDGNRMHPGGPMRETIHNLTIHYESNQDAMSIRHGGGSWKESST